MLPPTLRQCVILKKKTIFNHATTFSFSVCSKTPAAVGFVLVNVVKQEQLFRMLRRNKTFVKTTKSLEFEDSYYDEDFEEIEEADDDRLIEGVSLFLIQQFFGSIIGKKIKSIFFPVECMLAPAQWSVSEHRKERQHSQNWLTEHCTPQQWIRWLWVWRGLRGRRGLFSKFRSSLVSRCASWDEHFTSKTVQKRHQIQLDVLEWACSRDWTTQSAVAEKDYAEWTGRWDGRSCSCAKEENQTEGDCTFIIALKLPNLLQSLISILATATRRSLISWSQS